MDVTELLRGSGLRRTPARAAVLSTLSEATGPMTVHDITARLTLGSDLVTIYRTLNVLADKGILRRVRGDDRSWRYELASAGEDHTNHVHAHFVCDGCGKVECLPEVAMPALPTIPRRSSRDRGYAITKQELILHGKCPHCR
jgi:Fur family ferric uptake transcriptional regulator